MARMLSIALHLHVICGPATDQTLNKTNSNISERMSPVPTLPSNFWEWKLEKRELTVMCVPQTCYHCIWIIMVPFILKAPGLPPYLFLN